MNYPLENELWDKPNTIISFNDNNTLVMEKFQKFISDFCKSQSLNIINQKRLFDRFLLDISDQKTSDFSYHNCTYFLVERILEILNIQETFNDSLLKEVDEIIREKSLLIKKDTKFWKNQKKKMTDDLGKENQKHDSEFKRYCSRNNLKDVANITYLKAEENKSLSRNQVDNYEKMYLFRKSEYEQSKSDYSTVLNNFNAYQSNYYNSVLPEWAAKGEDIERARYIILQSTFTNLLEMCKSLASKSNEIADKIESQSNMIDSKKDFINLINKEKTGDIPPGAIAFKDFDVDNIVEISTATKVVTKPSSSSSDSASVTNGKAKSTSSEIKKRSDSMSSAHLNTSGNSNTSNGTVTTTSNVFTKLFGGLKKTKDSNLKPPMSDIEKLEELIEIKLAESSPYEVNECEDDEIQSLRNQLEIMKGAPIKSNIQSLQRKSKLFQSLRSRNTRNKSIDCSADITKDDLNNQVTLRKNIGNNSEKRRSQSVSSFNRTPCEMNNNGCDTTVASLQSSTNNVSVPKIKKRSIFGTQIKSKPKERTEKTTSFYSKSIEVIRITGPVEIVDTPADAMASVSRVNSAYAPEYEMNDDIHNKNCLINISPQHVDDSQVYQYFYIGSCVAIHEYTTSDPSDIYLSFNAGEQFYIIQENTECNGWLLVERIDKSKYGYVPESYMDTRNFDDPVPMQSNHPIMTT